MTPWSTEVDVIDGEHLRVTLMLSTAPGPVLEFRPFLDVDLDEAHATELAGKLLLALLQMRNRQECGAEIVIFPGVGA